MPVDTRRTPPVSDHTSTPRRARQRKPAADARAPKPVAPDTHEGATDGEVSDRTGPGAGYDTEPERVKDRGGVS